MRILLIQIYQVMKYIITMKNKLRKPLWLIAVCLFVVWAILGYKYQLTYNKGESMEPTHSDGDWIMVEKKERLPRGWEPDRYDVVIILDKELNDKLCKRVIGIAGDTIEIKEGIIYLNEKKLEDPFGQGKILLYLVDENDDNLRYWEGPEAGQPVTELINQKFKKIPEGYVWVVGDNRELSWYGLLKIKNIKGLVIL